MSKFIEFTQGCGAVDTSLLTAPSCKPTGMSESSRHPSPFCSTTVPKKRYIYRCFEVDVRCFEVDVRAIVVPCFRREVATSAVTSNFG